MNLFHYRELKTVLTNCKLGEKAQGRKIPRLFCIYPRRRCNIFRISFYLWSKKYCSGKTEISWHADQICISLLIVIIYKTTWTNVDLVKFGWKELFWILVRMNFRWIVRNFKLRRERKYINIHKLYYSSMYIYTNEISH